MLQRSSMSGCRPCLAVAAVIAMLGLSVSAYSAASPKGRTKKGVYHSAAGNFSVSVPKKDGSDWAHMIGVHQSEQYAPDLSMGMISFADDFGKVYGVFYARAHENSLPLLADTTRTYVLLEEWIRASAMPVVFGPASEQSRLVRVEETRLAGAPAAMALVNVPGGGTLTAQTSEGTRRLDSRRGLLVCVRQNYIYMLYNETLPWGQAFPDTTQEANLDLTQLVGDRLRPFYETIEFETKAEEDH